MRFELAVLVHEENVLLPLHDLEWVGHVGRARNARHVALRLGIRLGPAGHVLLSLLERCGEIRNRAAFDHALARRDRRDGAELPELIEAGRGVVFEIPVGVAERLPDAVEIRLAGNRRRARGRCTSTGGLRRCRCRTTTLACWRGSRGCRTSSGLSATARLSSERHHGQRDRRRYCHRYHCACDPVSHLPGLLL